MEKTIYRVIRAEKEALGRMEEELNEKEIEEALSLMTSCQGKIVFMGVGKSGHIGEKLAATFASLGTPSFYVHATEACHGDLGMIEKKDVCVLISNSGTTKEVLQDIAPLKAIGASLIAFTSHRDSPLAKEADARIIYPALEEADENHLAPTVSSTLTLALGDALACALSEAKGFSKEDFHHFHPNGALGEMLDKEKKNG